MRPHDVSGACGHTPPRRPHPAGVERRASAATPPAAIGSRPAPGTVRHPPRRAIPRPRFASPVPWKCRHPRKLEGAGPENSSATPPRRAVLQPRFRESAPRKTCVPRKTLDAVGPGTVRHPLGGLFLPARPGCRFPTCRPRVLTHPIRYPTASLISIGRQRVPIHRGAMMPRSCSSI